MSFDNAVTFNFADRFADFTESSKKPEVKHGYFTNPLVLLIALRESLDSHAVINLMSHLANNPQPYDIQRMPPILHSHKQTADDIMEYYGIKYATYRLTSATALSGYQKCVMDLRTRFQNDDYDVTDMEQKALWRLIDFHKVDTKLDTVVSESVNAEQLPDGDQELDCTVYTKFSLVNRRRSIHKAEVFLAKTVDQHVVMFDLPEKDPALPFLNYVFDNHHGFRVGVRKSRVSRLIPSTEFDVLVPTDYEVLKLY